MKAASCLWFCEAVHASYSLYGAPSRTSSDMRLLNPAFVVAANSGRPLFSTLQWSSTRLALAPSGKIKGSGLEQLFRMTYSRCVWRRAFRGCPAAAAVAAPSPVPQSRAVRTQASAESLTITRPDDWHLHLRDGDGMRSAVPHSAEVFKRAIIMPNLVPPVTTASAAMAYKDRILSALPADTPFVPLMTCYLTDRTTPQDVADAHAAGVIAFKLYPAGATTNSDSGVTDLSNVTDALSMMAELGMVLCVHGEVTESTVDIFDREREFIHRRLVPLLDKVPQLKVVMEHITTQDAAEFVSGALDNVAASITPQHMLHNRNALFNKGIRPHYWCLPILKREEHRQAVLAAATSGNPRFFLGTDSAPHPRGAKESACGCAGIFSSPAALPLYATAFDSVGALDKLEAFASFNGPNFYGLPRNTDSVTLVKEEWKVPDVLDFGDSMVVPMWAGELLGWKLQDSR